MEKHWKKVVPRSICDYFFDAQRKAGAPEDVDPVISTPRHYLISIYRSNMFLLAVCASEGTFIPFFQIIVLDYTLQKVRG